MSITTVATATRRTAREAVTSYISLTMMFVAALAGTLLHRVGGKDSDRGPSTLEYVFLAVLVVGAAAAAGAIVVRKIMSRANAIPD